MINAGLRPRSWTHTANLLLEGAESPREPLSRGWRAERMACCVVHSSGRELKLGLKSFNYYPSPRPFTPQRGETCRPTLPIGTSAEGGHTHIQHTP